MNIIYCFFFFLKQELLLNIARLNCVFSEQFIINVVCEVNKQVKSRIEEHYKVGLSDWLAEGIYQLWL